jgi:transposase
MLNSGYGFETISTVLLLDDSTLRRWSQSYFIGGIESLLKDNYTGSEPMLSREQIDTLEVHLEANVYMCAKEICAHVEQKWGIKYSSKGMTSLLHRLGFSYKKPKQVPGKANIEAQLEFVHKYRAVKEGKDPQDRIYFLDAVHQLHNSQPAYGWMKKNYTYTMPSNTGRERVNINGAYDIENQNVVIHEAERINAQSTVALFEKMLHGQPNGELLVVLDNAKYYRSSIVTSFIEKNPRIRLLFLPPYSPNLNIIERLWKFFKKKTTYNKYYEKFSLFKQACLDFFDKIFEFASELRSLMTDSFQLIQA